MLAHCGKLCYYPAASLFGIGGLLYLSKHTQAEKRHRQSLKRQARNYAYRSRLRSFVKRARLAITNNSEDKEKHVQAACRELDRMVTKGVIHKNTAARGKSQLMTNYPKGTDTQSGLAATEARTALGVESEQAEAGEVE